MGRALAAGKKMLDKVLKDIADLEKLVDNDLNWLDDPDSGSAEPEPVEVGPSGDAIKEE